MIIHEKQTAPPLVKKLPALHENQMFIAAFTTDPPPAPILSHNNSVHPSHPILKDQF